MRLRNCIKCDGNDDMLSWKWDKDTDMLNVRCLCGYSWEELPRNKRLLYIHSGTGEKEYREKAI